MSDNVDVDELAQLTEGYVGSEIAWVCDRALGLAIGEYIKGNPSRCEKPPFDIEIRKEHFLQSLEEYRTRKKEWIT